MFERLIKWLSGIFTCTKCGKVMHLMMFGYGETICPLCCNGEKEFIFFDKSYWLNRFLDRFITKPEVKT